MDRNPFPFKLPGSGADTAAVSLTDALQGIYVNNLSKRYDHLRLRRGTQGAAAHPSVT